MPKSILPAAAMEKLLKKTGAKRVSQGAKIALRDVLEDIGGKIGKKAIDLAAHSNRTTVKEKDIKLAAKE